MTCPRSAPAVERGSSITRSKPPSASSVTVERGLRQPQQALRRHHDQRPRLGHERLAAQQVEVLGRRGAVGHPDVALGRALEEALEPRARVLGARALVAVRQQQREPRGLPPLGQPGHEELVDDHLGRVHEVAELGLPEHERVGRLDAVAVLEAHARLLRQRAVVKLERRHRVAQLLERAPARAGVRVVQHRVALAERAALGVLAREPHRHAEREQRRERQRLGVRPVDALALLEARAPPLDERPQLAVHLEVVGHAQQLLVERPQRLLGKRGARLAAHGPVELVLARSRGARRSSA